MLKLSDLAQRLDFRLGPLSISPSRRHVEGPAGEVHVEPLVMQVFLLLLHARGKVVTRNELFDQCWGGVIVGDDSLNRAIGGVRRIAAETAPGLFEIETIPRTGYRLTGELQSQRQMPESIDVGDPNGGRGLSRRTLAMGGAAAAAAVGGAGLWWFARSRTDPIFAAFMTHGDEALRNGTTDEPHIGGPLGPDIIGLYKQAVRLDPRNAKAWGLLAYFRSRKVADAPADNSARTVHEAEDAIRRAIEIDPLEPNAITAIFLLSGTMLDWAGGDNFLRSILAIDGSNIPAMSELVAQLQATGFTRESWIWNERVLGVAPHSRPHLVARAMKLWVLGNVTASDKVIDRVRRSWPLYAFGFFTRLMLFTLTNRPGEALAMIDGAPAHIRALEKFTLWQSAAEALESLSPKAVEAARIACLDVARNTPWSLNNAIMILSALGQTDAAFGITDRYLLWRNKLLNANQTEGKGLNDYSRQMTPSLFTPPVSVMRADPRFRRLCDELGLAAYWRTRGVQPDYARS